MRQLRPHRFGAALGAIVFVALLTHPGTAISATDPNVARLLQKLIAQTPQVRPTGEEGDMQMYLIGAQHSGGFPPDLAATGRLANGQDVLAAPMDTGGSGGAFEVAVWTKFGGTWHYAGYVPTGGHTSASVKHGELLIDQPAPQPGEPDCCHAIYRRDRYTLDHVKLRRLGTLHVKVKTQ